MTFFKHGYKNFVLYSSTMAFICSQLISKDTRQIFLNIRSNIKDNTLWFFSSYFFKEKRKESKIPITSFLMLEAKDANLKTIFSYSSIMLLKEVIGSVWAMNFKPWIW